MSFRITGLDFAAFRSLVGLPDDALRARGAVRVLADRSPGYPDRIELRDALPGEQLILVNYLHQPADSPFRASHAVFVLEHPQERYDRVDEVPEVLRSRMISLRAFDEEGMIAGAELCRGTELEPSIDRLLAQPRTSYLHLHYAAYGCYACRVDRVS
ncbi:DUF1203 domain-containing protein [Ottowia sp.]|uniref:DUF1203 domain-containing protein n=1 Tax=Ottowia sp. TaxID=1898956 RepID=UPI001DEF2C9A|nr:DUF1203 domain-containing protein [Ottowia sp.]MCB2037064.1 DUF1203 domain-containing protein [Ottowia sp.]